MSKILANQFANFAQNGPVEALEGILISDGKNVIIGSLGSISLDGDVGSAGQYLTSLGSGQGLSWSSPIDIDTTYTFSAIDAALPEAKIIRLQDNNAQAQDITLAGVNGVGIVRSGDSLTFTLNPATFPATLNAPNTDAIFQDITIRNVTTQSGGALDVNGDVDISGAATIGTNLTVTGNLTVQGDTTQLNVQEVNVEDNQIILNSNVDAQTAPALNGLFTINRGSSNDVSLQWNEATDRWQITNDGSTYYNIPVDGEYAVTDTNTITSIGTTGNQTTGTVTVQGGGATTVTQSGQLITISSVDTNDNTVTEVGTAGNETSGTVTFAGSGATTVTQVGNTITIDSTDTNTDTNTTYDLSAEDGADASRKIIRLTASSADPADDIILKAGSNISLARTNNEIEIIGAPPGAVTTYAISSETGTPSGAAIRLTGSDNSTDDVSFIASGATTITRTDANTITISSTDTDTDTITSVGTAGNEVSGTVTLAAGGATSISQVGSTITITSTDTNTDTNTTYSFNAATATGGAFLRLSDNIGGTNDVKLVGGSNVSVTRNSSSEIEIGLGLPQGLSTTDSPTFDFVYFGNEVANLTDLPNAATYPGMFVTVAATGASYYAYNSNWVRLLDTGSTGAQTIAGDLNISGNLTVSGDTVQLNVATLNVEDNQILLNSNVDGTTQASLNALITVNRGADNDVEMRWNETSNRWEITNDGVNYYNIPVTGEYATTDTDTVTRVRATTTGSYIDGDITLVAQGSASVVQSGNTITLTASDTDTVTSVGTSGNQVTGTVTLQGSGSTTVSQSGNTITISSTDTDTNTITRVRGSNSGIYQTGDITIVGQGSALVTQNGTTITVTASDNNTITSVGTSGNAVTGTVVLAGSGGTTVSQIGQTITFSSTDTDTTYTAGTGVSITGVTNEIAIGQPVATTDQVTFSTLTTTGIATIDGINITNGVGGDTLSTGVGLNALNSTTTNATRNTAIGYQSQLSNQNGDDNTTVGYFAGRSAQGSGNTLLGSNAGANLGTGSYNVLIGDSIQALDNSANTQLAIGSNGATWMRGDANRHVNSIAFDGLREYTTVSSVSANDVVALKQDGNVDRLSRGVDLTTLPTPTASADKLVSTLATQWGFGGSNIQFAGGYTVSDHYNTNFGGIVSWMWDASGAVNKIGLTATVANYEVEHRTTNVLVANIPFTTQPSPNSGLGAIGYLGTVSGKERYAVAVGDSGQISVAIIDIDGSFNVTLVAEFLDIYNFVTANNIEPNLFVEDVNNFFLVQHDAGNNNAYMFHFDDEGGSWQQNTTRQVLSNGSQQPFYKNRGAARVGTKQWVVVGTNSSGNLEIGHYTLSSGNQPAVNFTGTAPALTSAASAAYIYGQLIYYSEKDSLAYITENQSNEPCIIVFNENGSAFTFGSWTNYTNASVAYRARNGQYVAHYNDVAGFWTLITGTENNNPAYNGYRKLTIDGGAIRSSTLSDAILVDSNLANFEFTNATGVDNEVLLGYPADYFIPIGSDAFTHRLFALDALNNPVTFWYTRKAYTTTYSPDPNSSQIIGLAKEAATGNSSVEVQYSGTYAGLSIATARDYYPDYSNSSFTVSSSTPIDYPTTFKPIGKALSGSELYIYDGQAGAGGGGTTIVAAAGGGGGATYTVSAETVAGGAEVRLTGSDATTDGVDLIGSNGLTVTRTSADIITLDGANFMQSLSDDTAPSLGGNLSTSGSNILFDTNDVAGFSSNRLQIYHTGAAGHAFIENTQGNIYIRTVTGTVNIEPAAGSASIIATAAGSVALHHNANLKLETTATGVDITGTLNVTSLNIGGVAYLPGNPLIDDDTFGTASATNVASAESIKAYVDAQDARSLSVVTVTGGAKVDLIDADGSTVQDSFDIVGAGGATVSRFDADTIQIDTADTKYTTSAVSSGSDVIVRLTGSDASTDDLTITPGTGIAFTNITASGFTIDGSGAGGGLTALSGDANPVLGGNLSLSTYYVSGTSASTNRANGNYIELGSGVTEENARIYYFKPGTGPTQLEFLAGSESDIAFVTKNVYNAGASTSYRNLLTINNNGDTDDTGASNSVSILHGTLVDSTYTRIETTTTGSKLYGNVNLPESTVNAGVYNHAIEVGDYYNATPAGGLLTYNDNRVQLIAGTSKGPRLRGSNVEIYSQDGSEAIATFTENGSVALYYDQGTYTGPKLETTATGIDVDGTVNATALAGDGTAITGVTFVQSRTTASTATPSISSGQSSNITISGFKSYMLMNIATDSAAWVTLYTDTASRTADASRAETTDPAPGSGVIAEVITTGSSSQIITPAVVGFNNESPATNNIYAKVVNKGGSATAITVTLTLLQLEA